MQKKIFFTSRDGIRLAGIWHLPDKSSDKVIVLAHGITVDKDESGVFVELAKLLELKGYAVFRFDFRGHGESKGQQVEMTITGELLDLESAIQQVRGEGYKRLGLLAASFGGGVGALYASQNQSVLTSVCLWNPCLNYDHTFIHPTLPWIVKKKGHMAKELQDQGWTTVGSRKYKIGIKLWNEMTKLQPYEALKSISIPTEIIHSDIDTYVPYRDSKNYVSYLQRGKLVTIPHADHGFHKPLEARRQALQYSLTFFQETIR